MKKALITGITGQDGSYLAELLLEKGYIVHGIKRRSSSFNTQRLDKFFDHPNLHLHYGDLTDSTNLIKLISEIEPDEVYNLGAQSHVAVSFDVPEYTADVNALGTLRLLEAIRFLKLEKKTRFYQASTSELFGSSGPPQSELTPFHPRSPYAVAKLYAYWIVRNYREAYGVFACNGILFNHESPRRGETFVTRKITRGIAEISLGVRNELRLGNLDAKRDWGHAKDYVYMQWLMLQQDEPCDLVIATGRQITVREFVAMSARQAGFELSFTGSGLDEYGVVSAIHNPEKCPRVKVGDIVICVDKEYFRAAEVETLLGNAQKARELLGWAPDITVEEMCIEMVESDLQQVHNTILCYGKGTQL